jgi:hypothetical protein
MAALLSGLSIAEVSRQYNLPKQTVSRIKNEMVPEQLGQIGTEKRHRLDDLLLDALASNLAAQKRIADTVSEPEYVRKQSATAVAELYEVLADKAVRLLEAASFGEEDADASVGDSEEADEGEAE